MSALSSASFISGILIVPYALREFTVRASDNFYEGKIFSICEKGVKNVQGWNGERHGLRMVRICRLKSFSSAMPKENSEN